MAVAVAAADDACKITGESVKNWRLNWCLNEYILKYSIKFLTDLINNFWSSRSNSTKFSGLSP